MVFPNPTLFRGRESEKPMSSFDSEESGREEVVVSVVAILREAAVLTGVDGRVSACTP